MLRGYIKKRWPDGLGVVVFLVAMSFSPAYAGWDLVNPGPIAGGVNDVDVATPKVAYFVGGDGIILKTTNGGDSWERKDAFFCQEDLYTVCFPVNEDLGYVAGASGILLRTENGGDDWEPVDSGLVDVILNIGFSADGSIGFAASNAQTSRTTDGGLTWTIVYNDPVMLNQALAVDASGQTILQAGFNDVGVNLITASYDGGTTWNPVGETTFTVWGLVLTDSHTAHAVGSDGFYGQSTDGGVTWVASQYGDEEDGYYGVGFAPGGQLGIMTGSGRTYCRTTDGGATWTRYPGSSDFYHTAVDFAPDVQTVWMVGEGPGLFESNDAGATWADHATGVTDESGYRVEFPVDNQTGFVSFSDGAVWKTADGGVNWSQHPTGQTGGGLDGIDFLDTQTGYVCGDGGFVAKTTDGGETWVEQTANTTQWLTAISFPAGGNTGYLVGAGGVVRKTNNGGANWLTQSLGVTHHFKALCFPINASTGYIGGANGSIYKTTNGGFSWTLQATGTTAYIWQIDFPEGVDVGYAVGGGGSGVVLKTTDGGANWQNLTANLPTSFRFIGCDFFDNQTGWVVGQDNQILKTSDGGATWTAQETPASNMIFGIQFPVNPNVGYAVGTEGNILKTLNGGEPGGGATPVQDVAPQTRVQLSIGRNPIPRETTFRFSLPTPERVRLGVYAINGRLVRELVAGEVHAAGQHAVGWDSRDQAGRRAPAGVYLVRLQAGSEVTSRRVVLVK